MFDNNGTVTTHISLPTPKFDINIPSPEGPDNCGFDPETNTPVSSTSSFCISTKKVTSLVSGSSLC